MEKDTGNHSEHCFASAYRWIVGIYFINEGNRIYKGTIIKILLIVTGNILFLVLLFWGEKICSVIKNTTFLKIADVILLLATPGIVFMLVQMVTWVSGYKNKAVSTFKGLVKMSLLMEQPYLTHESYYLCNIFYNIYYLIQENQYCFFCVMLPFYNPCNGKLLCNGIPWRTIPAS